MLVLISAYGNHSNRLIQAARFETFCAEYHLTFINPVRHGLKAMIRYRYSAVFDLCILALARLLRKMRFAEYINIDEYEEKAALCDKLCNKKGMVFVSGFVLGRDDLLVKYRDTVLSRYRNAEHHPDIDRLRMSREAGKTVIGVHIRLGDYAKYRGGEYYYPVSKYVAILKKFILSNKLTDCFISVFSDQKLDDSDFTDFTDTLFSHNAYNIDYELMGLCDYLIGPPSTFTQWASFSYNVPYVHVLPDTDTIRMSDFQIAFS